MDEKAKDFPRIRLRAKIGQVLRGEMKEYWLQEYIKHHYRKLGFSEMSEPRAQGYDLVGVRNGKTERV